MAALFGLELRRLEVPGLHLQGLAAEKLQTFLCSLLCFFFWGGVSSFYRSLLSDQKPLSSARMGCPRAQETLPLRVGRPGKEGVTAAPTRPTPGRNKPRQGKELACGYTFQQSLHLRVRQTWVYTLVPSPRN